jgi:peptidoglycan/LPS O-acetylase OafA/YrhL
MSKKLNFDILESLRGVAALYVCIGHCRGNLWVGGEHYLRLHPQNTLGFFDYLLLSSNMLTRLTTEFVIVFFVLSGFSIAHSLRNTTNALPFYKRRFIRLYPPYLAAIFWAMLVVFLIQLIFPQFVDGTYKTPTFDRLAASRELFNWKVFCKNLIYVPQIDGVLRPFWSLTQEVIFYILAPFLFRNRKIYYFISIILFMGVTTLMRSGLVRETIIADYFYYNIFFVIGVALYNNFEWICGKASVFTTRKSLWTAIGVFLLMIFISLFVKNYELITAFISAFMSIILIMYLLSQNVQVKPLIAIGRFSYTLYITHFATIMLFMTLYYLISNATPPYIYNNILFIPAILFCVGIAWLNYTLVEKRSKAILKKLRIDAVNQAKRDAAVEKTVATIVKD